MQGYISAFVGALIIGWAPIFVRLADVSPSAIGVFRMGIAGLALAVLTWYLVPGARLKQKRLRVVVVAGFVCGLFYAADLVLWHWAIRFTSVAKAAMLANLAPIFVMLWIAFSRRALPSRLTLAATLVCLVGVGLLLEMDKGLVSAATIGDLLGIATAVAYAGYIIGSARYGAAIPTPLLMSATCLFCVLALAPTTTLEVAWFGERLWPGEAVLWLPLLGLALMVHCGGQGLIVLALRKVNPTHVSLILLLQPASAIVWSNLIFDESLTQIQIFGMLLVFAGLYFVLRDRPQRDSSDPALDLHTQ